MPPLDLRHLPPPEPMQRILDALEATMPNATRVTIPKAAHSVQADNPAAFNAAVLAFLAAA